jgi:hypothetical protein
MAPLRPDVYCKCHIYGLNYVRFDRRLDCGITVRRLLRGLHGPTAFRLHCGDEMTEKRTVSSTKAILLKLYAARRFLDGNVQQELGLKIPFSVYFQDPLFAKQNPELAFDEAVVPWEPGFSPGPTSARFAVVDFNADTGSLVPASTWNEEEKRFCDSAGTPIGDKSFEEQHALEAHQVHVWAVIQRAL